jgi:STE24 endopeptidase
MQFLLLVIFGLICWQNAQSQLSPESLWPAGPVWLTPGGCALLTWAGVLAVWLVADIVTRWYCWRLQRVPWRRGLILQRFARARQYVAVAILSGYLVLLYGLGWGGLVEKDWRLGIGLPGAELITMGPLLGALLLSWERFYRLEKTAFEMAHFGDHYLGKWNYLVLQLRNNLLIIVPPACLWLVQQVLELFLPSADDNQSFLLVVYFGLLGVALVGLPLLLRAFLGLRPLPASLLRERLEATARRLGFRFGDILVWDTHMTMANALISGFLPWPRYVVLTDRLLVELTAEEIEAVFGHEVGHVRYHHMGLYVLFCLASLVLLGATGGYLKGLAEPHLASYLRPWETTHVPAEACASVAGILAGPDGALAAAPLLLSARMTSHAALLTALNILTVCVIALYFVFVFGILSRYCERQADLFGSQATSSEAFIGALEKVARINGIPREHGGLLASWRHPSIAQRIDFVQRVSGNPRLASRFHLSLRLFKWGLAVSLPCFLAAVWWFVGPEKVWELVSAM